MSNYVSMPHSLSVYFTLSGRPNAGVKWLLVASHNMHGKEGSWYILFMSQINMGPQINLSFSIAGDRFLGE